MRLTQNLLERSVFLITEYESTGEVCTFEKWTQRLKLKTFDAFGLEFNWVYLKTYYVTNYEFASNGGLRIETRNSLFKLYDIIFGKFPLTNYDFAFGTGKF